MINIYDWLFERYALPKLRRIEESYTEALTAFSERTGLSSTECLRLLDMVSSIRLEWGTEAFAQGVRFGLGLAGTRPRRRERGWLLDFLP